MRSGPAPGEDEGRLLPGHRPPRRPPGPQVHLPRLRAPSEAGALAGRPVPGRLHARRRSEGAEGHPHGRAALAAAPEDRQGARRSGADVQPDHPGLDPLLRQVPPLRPVSRPPAHRPLPGTMGLQEVEATPRTPAARPPVAGPRGSGPATAVRALVLPPRVGLGDKSRMSREVHVRFCERAGVRFPRATRPVLPVLDPGRGRTKTGRLWGYAIDDRPWQGRTPPAGVYLYAEDRRGEHPAAHLAEFRGILQVDGYGGFKSLLADRPAGEIRLAFCWAHCRRRFYEIHQATGSPLAEEALRRIGELYKVEAEIRGRPAEERRAARRERSRPVVDALHAWLTAQLGRVSGKSGLAEAIRYALRHWQGLVLFLEDGRLELDTNTVERAIRPISLGRKNALFAGSDGGACHWAIVASLVATAKLNGDDPLAWLTDVLERVVSGRTKAHELECLLPWTWKAVRLAAAGDA